MSDAAPFPNRWSLALSWGLVQSLFIFAATLIVAWQIESVNGKNGFALGLRHWERLGEVLGSIEYYFTAGGISLGLLLLQALLILPVRKPRPRASRGAAVMTSLVVAGLAIGMLVLGIAFTLTSVVRMVFAGGNNLYLVPWAMIAIGCSAWAVSTILLVRWTRGKPYEDALTRVSYRIFQGTIIEAAAVMPVEVMVRRRTDCYCGEATLWTLIICGSVGTLVLGPAIWLPILAKRRRAWYGGHCGFCGYEMGDLAAERCPECGTGWKHSKNAEVRERASAADVNSVD